MLQFLINCLIYFYIALTNLYSHKYSTHIPSPHHTPLQPHQDLTSCSTDTCSAMFIATLITIARKWIQPKCPPNGKQE